MNNLALIIASVLGGGVGAALVTQLFTRRNSRADATKTHAEAGQIVTTAAEALVAMMQSQLNEARAEVMQLRGEVLDLTRQVASLSAKLAFHEGQQSATAPTATMDVKMTGTATPSVGE